MAAATEETRQLTLPEARSAAAQALRLGQPQTTLLLTRGLLQANRKDGVAHYLQASAYARLGRPGDARAAAARAYRFGTNNTQKFEAAQLAARLAVAEERPGMAQLWLRRTAIHSPNEAADKGIARDYTRLRQINPWSFRLNGSLQPSDNVNNGADSPLNIIDGVPYVGLNSGAAQALSGVIGTLDFSLGYRLSQNERRETRVGARYYLQRVQLSDDARALAPSASNSDFAFDYGELNLSHRFLVGDNQNAGPVNLTLSFGHAEYGGVKIYDTTRLNAARRWRLSDQQQLSLGLSAERRNSIYQSLDGTIWGANAGLTYSLAGNSELEVSLSFRDSRAASVNGTSRATALSAVYTLGRKLGPARVQAGLGLAQTDYPRYLVGNIVVPGGRQDEAWNANIDFVFEDIDYAGFAPRLSLRTARTSSNISRFATEQLTLTLGIASKF